MISKVRKEIPVSNIKIGSINWSAFWKTKGQKKMKQKKACKENNDNCPVPFCHFFGHPNDQRFFAAEIIKILSRKQFDAVRRLMKLKDTVLVQLLYSFRTTKLGTRF